ncbi:hypothetical protein CFIMG_007882RA00001 [Ceratocystis fimbriata CBS 114723]|uniref:Uncharacterized protein n=1 Tax=Ceratocystis fimbriata CBS 114723 TaxID=1035309 RepID=A0A2C5WTQ2_9PEZI|nr:hypothetical protein CFIMG_007882RA00001 [Ceratocystis fimbriata CBS 114723]
MSQSHPPDRDLVDSPTPLNANVIPDPTVPSVPTHPWMPTTARTGQPTKFEAFVSAQKPHQSFYRMASQGDKNWLSATPENWPYPLIADSKPGPSLVPPPSDGLGVSPPTEHNIWTPNSGPDNTSPPLFPPSFNTVDLIEQDYHYSSPRLLLAPDSDLGMATHSPCEVPRRLSSGTINLRAAISPAPPLPSTGPNSKKSISSPISAPPPQPSSLPLPTIETVVLHPPPSSLSPPCECDRDGSTPTPRPLNRLAPAFPPPQSALPPLLPGGIPLPAVSPFPLPPPPPFELNQDYLSLLATAPFYSINRNRTPPSSNAPVLPSSLIPIPSPTPPSPSVMPQSPITPSPRSHQHAVVSSNRPPPPPTDGLFVTPPPITVPVPMIGPEASAKIATCSKTVPSAFIGFNSKSRLEAACSGNKLRATIYDDDEIEEIRKGEDYSFPPRKGPTQPGPLTESDKSRFMSHLMSFAKHVNQKEFSSPSTSITESIDMDEIQLLWKTLKTKQTQVYDLRGRMAKHRSRLSSIRSDEADISYKLITQIRRQMKIEFPESLQETQISTVERLFANAQAMRAEYQRAQDEYDDLDLRLDSEEEEIASLEVRFFAALQGKPEAEDSRKEKFPKNTNLPKVPIEIFGISTDLVQTPLPTQYIKLENAVADFNLCFEELHDLVSCNSQLKDEIEYKSRFNPNFKLDIYDQELIDTFPEDRKRLSKSHMDAREAVINQLRLCISQGHMPDPAFIPLDIMFVLSDMFYSEFMPWLRKQPCDSSRVKLDPDMTLEEPKSQLGPGPPDCYPLIVPSHRKMEGSLADGVKENLPKAGTIENDGVPSPFSLGNLIDKRAPPTQHELEDRGKERPVGNWLLVNTWLEHQVRSSTFCAFQLERAFEQANPHMNMPCEVWERMAMQSWYNDETRLLADDDGFIVAPVTPPVST